MDKHDELAHELWSAAQLAPGEGIEDGVERIAARLRAEWEKEQGEIVECNVTCKMTPEGVERVTCNSVHMMKYVCGLEQQESHGEIEAKAIEDVAQVFSEMKNGWLTKESIASVMYQLAAQKRAASGAEGEKG